jgi:mRNA-degrading endonuclease RelE of RelBE toxin-antitoxin system
MNVLQTRSFGKAVKKLHKNQKKDLDQAIQDIVTNRDIGDEKAGDLSGVSVYKFKMAKQQALLAYAYNDKSVTLTLLALGSHENFYRDLKKNK